MEKMDELRACVEAVGRDAGKFFEKGNKAAGVRARKHLQECKRLSGELRVVIQESKNKAVEQEQAARQANKQQQGAAAAGGGGGNVLPAHTAATAGAPMRQVPSASAGGISGGVRAPAPSAGGARVPTGSAPPHGGAGRHGFGGGQ